MKQTSLYNDDANNIVRKQFVKLIIFLNALHALKSRTLS